MVLLFYEIGSKNMIIYFIASNKILRLIVVYCCEKSQNQFYFHPIPHLCSLEPSDPCDYAYAYVDLLAAFYLLSQVHPHAHGDFL